MARPRKPLSPGSNPSPIPLLQALLVLVPTAFCPLLTDPFGETKSSLFLAIPLALLVLAASAARGRTWVELTQTVRTWFGGPVGLVVFATAVLAIVTTILSMSPLTSLLGAADSHAGLGNALALIVVFAAARQTGAHADHRLMVLEGVIVALALAVGYALIQIAGLDPMAWAGASLVGTWVRPVGTLGHPNALAGYLVLGIPILIWRLRSCSGRISRMTLGTLTVCAAIVVLVSLSRAAWLAGLLTLPLLLVVMGPRERKVLVVAGVAGLALAAICYLGNESLASSLRGRIAGLWNSPSRLAIWETAWRMFLAAPWTGSGLDTFGLAFTDLRTPEYWDTEWGVLPVRAHNDVLQALATQGILGGVTYLALPLTLVWTAGQAWRERPHDRSLIAALLATVVSFVVQNLLGFANPATEGALAVVAGLLAALRDPPITSLKPQRRNPQTLWSLAGIAWSILVLGIVQGASARPGAFLASGLLLAGMTVACILAFEGTPACTTSFQARLPELPSIRLPIAIPGCLAIVGFVGLPLAASAVAQHADRLLPVRPREAIRFHALATQLQPWESTLRIRQATALLVAAGTSPPAEARQHLDDARNAVTLACQLVPCSASHHANRARVLGELARQGMATSEETLEAFDRALALDPCDVIARADAAQTAITAGRVEDAERYLHQGWKGKGTLALLRVEEGAVALAKAGRSTGPEKRGYLERARNHLQEAIANPALCDGVRLDRARLLLGLAALTEGATGQALALGDEVLTRHQDWVSAWFLTGAALEQQGSRPQALERYQEALRRQPGHPQAQAGCQRLRP